MLLMGMGMASPAALSQSTTPAASLPWVAQSNTRSARDYAKEGDRLFTQEDYQGAIQAYTQSIQLFPANAYAYYNRGNAYRKLEKYKEAVFDYNRSLQINPQNNFAYLYRGLALLTVNQVEAAAANFSEVIKRDENNATAYHYRGDAHLRLNQREAAIEDYTQAVDLYKKMKGKGDVRRDLKKQLTELKGEPK